MATSRLTDLGALRLGARAQPPDPSLLGDAQDLSEALGVLLRVTQFRDRDRVCCYDVSVSQCHALKNVVDSGGVTVNELAAHLYLDKSTASRLANGLVEKGYVERERDAEDGRVAHLVATPRGEALCEAIVAGERAEYARLLADFDPEVRRAMIRLVARLSGCFAGSVEASGGSCCVVK